MPRTARLDAPGTLHHVICHRPTQTRTDVFLKFVNDRFEPYPDTLPFTIASSPEIFIQKLGDSHETLTTGFYYTSQSTNRCPGCGSVYHNS